jgi:hypothetical protein
LSGPANPINQSSAAEWLRIMEYDYNTGTSLAQHAQNAKKTLWKSA